MRTCTLDMIQQANGKFERLSIGLRRWLVVTMGSFAVAVFIKLIDCSFAVGLIYCIIFLVGSVFWLTWPRYKCQNCGRRVNPEWFRVVKSPQMLVIQQLRCEPCRNTGYIGHNVI